MSHENHYTTHNATTLSHLVGFQGIHHAHGKPHLTPCIVSQIQLSVQVTTRICEPVFK